RPVPGLRKFLALIVTCGLGLLFYVVGHHISGFKRHFSFEDMSYAVHQRVGTHALHFISAVIPFIAQVIINLATVRSWVDFHHSTLGLLLSYTVTGSITQIVKVAVGRPRPDVISRCQPIPGSVDPVYGLSAVDICTQTVKYILDDGWRGFPSGHSSSSFAGLGFLTFYLAGKLHIFDKRGYAGKIWLVFTPLSGAVFVAISCTMDYRHHWHDVVIGSALGLILSYISYRQYYPGLAEADAHLPHMKRFEELLDDGGADIPVYRDAEVNEDAAFSSGEETIGLLGRG
ncbi:acid phosphatase/Vanadium-dependent haloperoxidase, partial [Pisolithus orientalis]|uniref:acid phosphatase/Vanadium-dependent haloperoxidase n=1 Tax=Pisolithus orientalis TaxID=936130 RepID=UPI0022242CBC